MWGPLGARQWRILCDQAQHGGRAETTLQQLHPGTFCQVTPGQGEEIHPQRVKDVTCVTLILLASCQEWGVITPIVRIRKLRIEESNISKIHQQGRGRTRIQTRSGHRDLAISFSLCYSPWHCCSGHFIWGVFASIAGDAFHFTFQYDIVLATRKGRVETLYHG